MHPAHQLPLMRRIFEEEKKKLLFVFAGYRISLSYSDLM